MEDLELDHLDPAQKVSHRIWSWSQARREAEIDKCQILCGFCHSEKTTESDERPAGRSNGQAVHSDATIISAYIMRGEGMSYGEIARLLGLKSRWTVRDLLKRKSLK